MKHTYGKEGTEFPVQTGDVWTAGEHVFTCGSMFDIHPYSDYDMVYADPPWRLGDVKAFYTKAGLNCPVQTLEQFFDAVVSHAKPVKTYAFIEGSIHTLTDLKASVFRANGKVLRVWDTTYYQKHPNVTICATWKPELIVPSAELLEGMDDDFTPAAAMQWVKSVCPDIQTVYDCCSGRGLTSRAAHQNGLTSLNLELHPNRVSAALSRMYWHHAQSIRHVE